VENLPQTEGPALAESFLLLLCRTEQSRVVCGFRTSSGDWPICASTRIVYSQTHPESLPVSLKLGSPTVQVALGSSSRGSGSRRWI